MLYSLRLREKKGMVMDQKVILAMIAAMLQIIAVILNLLT